MDHRRLGRAETRERLARFGPNALPHAPPVDMFRIFLRQFRSPLIYILLLAAALQAMIVPHARVLRDGGDVQTMRPIWCRAISCSWSPATRFRPICGCSLGLALTLLLALKAHKVLWQRRTHRG